jgi:hypothetical protein
MRIYNTQKARSSGPKLVQRRNKRRRESYAASKLVPPKAADGDTEMEAPLDTPGGGADDVFEDSLLLNEDRSGAAGEDGHLLNTDRSGSAGADGVLLNADQSGASGADGVLLNADRSGAAGEDGLLLNVSDRSTGLMAANDTWSALSPKTKNACILAHWQATRGKCSDSAMADLVENVIPQLDPEHLPTWRQVPGLVFAADGYNKPVSYEFIVCKTCGVTKDESLEPSHCPWCTTRATVADSWVTQGCTVMHLRDIVRSWFRNPADASALLAYLRKPEVKSSMPHSSRARTCYELLDRFAEDASMTDGAPCMYVLTSTDRSVCTLFYRPVYRIDM